MGRIVTNQILTRCGWCNGTIEAGELCAEKDGKKYHINCDPDTRIIENR